MRANDSKTIGAGSILLGMVAVALTGMVGTISLIRQVGELGPKVGDIVAFEPLDSMSRDMRARLTVGIAGSSSGKTCVLDVRTLHANGGSLIVEARVPEAKPVFHVHWSGARSSNDGADCGPSNDLTLTIEDVEVLALAAGGYGVPASRAGGSFWRAAGSVQ